MLVAGLVPFRTNYDQLESLGNAESVRSFELLRGGFPAGALSPTQLYVSLPPGTNALDPVALEQLDILTLELTGHPAVADASGPTRPLGTKGPAASQLPAASAQRFVSADGRAGRIDVVLKTNPFSQEALETPLRLGWSVSIAAGPSRVKLVTLWPDRVTNRMGSASGTQGMALRAREYGRSVCRDRSNLSPHLVTK